jgi:hypothetical protein
MAAQLVSNDEPNAEVNVKPRYDPVAKQTSSAAC